jgi:cytochrome c
MNENQPDESELYQHDTKARVYVIVIALMFAGISLSWFGATLIWMQPGVMINLDLTDAVHGAAAAAQLERGAQLEELQCSGCHALNERLVGPSYAEIVDFYTVGGRVMSDDSSMISGAISHASENWSSYPKGPALKLDLADRSALAYWIMKNTENLNSTTAASGGIK